MRALGLTALKLVLFTALIMVVGRRLVPWILRKVAGTGSRELFTLAVLAIALGVAYASAQWFGVSIALGAFFAGMLLNESELSHKAAADSLPMRDAFAVLFFVSVGMLFDPTILLRQPLQVLGCVLIIMPRRRPGNDSGGSPRPRAGCGAALHRCKPAGIRHRAALAGQAVRRTFG